VEVEASGKIIQDNNKFCAETITIKDEYIINDIEDLYVDAYSNSGVFCADGMPTLRFFDKDSDWTAEKWFNSSEYRCCEDIFYRETAIEDITQEQWQVLEKMPNWDKEKFIKCVETQRANERLKTQ